MRTRTWETLICDLLSVSVRLTSTFTFTSGTLDALVPHTQTCDLGLGRRTMMRSVGQCAATAFIGLILGFIGMTTPAFSACQIKEFAELQVSPGSGAPLVVSQINGHQVLLVVDTAANVTLLWLQPAVQLGLKPKSLVGVDAYSFKGQVPVQSLTLGNFQFGNYAVRNFTMFILDENPTDLRASGLIGQDIIALDDVEFDLPENVIRLVKPVGCKGTEVVFWNKAYSMAPLNGFDDNEKKFYTTAIINGRSIEAIINTEAQSSELSFELATALGLVAVPSRGAGVDNSKLTGRIASFSLGDEVIKNTVIKIAEPRGTNSIADTGTRLGAKSLPSDLVLGADFFRAHRVLLAKSQDMMYFSYMGGPVFDLTGSTKSDTPPADKAGPLTGPASH